MINLSCVVFAINADRHLAWCNGISHHPLWEKKMKLILEDEKELTSGSESLLPVPLLLHQHFREEKNMGGFQACQRHLQGMFVR